MEEDRQQAELEDLERLMRKNKRGNYGLFAEKCDHCVDGPAGGSVLSSESSLKSITVDKPLGKSDHKSVFDQQRETVSLSQNKLYSKGHRGLESIREDDKGGKKSVAFRQSGQAQISGHAVNKDIQSELESMASSTSEGMQDKRDDPIPDKKGLTYREAALLIMSSLNEVSKRLNMDPLVEPVVENATKAVQKELNR